MAVLRARRVVIRWACSGGWLAGGLDGGMAEGGEIGMGG